MFFGNFCGSSILLSTNFRSIWSHTFQSMLRILPTINDFSTLRHIPKVFKIKRLIKSTSRDLAILHPHLVAVLDHPFGCIGMIADNPVGVYVVCSNGSRFNAYEISHCSPIIRIAHRRIPCGFQFTA